MNKGDAIIIEIVYKLTTHEATKAGGSELQRGSKVRSTRCKSKRRGGKKEILRIPYYLPPDGKTLLLVLLSIICT